MIRKYLWAFHLLFLLGFSYFVADLINLFIGRQLEVPIIRTGIPPIHASQPQILPTPEVYDSIVNRNIFAVNPLGDIRPMEEAVIAPVQLPPLRLRLIGTVVGGSEDSLAVIEDPGTREQRIYRLQDQVQPDAQLVDISRNEVTFQRGSIQEILSVEEDGAPVPQVSNRFPVPSSQPAIPSVSQNRWILDKQEVASAMENLPQLLTKARVVPNLTGDGKSNGFRIVSISPSSFYERIGLRNGDVIQRINGIDVRDPATFMSVFTQLREETQISLDLERNNQKETFSYEIR